nr:hypothetical protein CFP56_75091 [Quercus suber]
MENRSHHYRMMPLQTIGPRASMAKFPIGVRPSAIGRNAEAGAIEPLPLAVLDQIPGIEHRTYERPMSRCET